MRHVAKSARAYIGTDVAVTVMRVTSAEMATSEIDTEIEPLRQHQQPKVVDRSGVIIIILIIVN